MKAVSNICASAKEIGAKIVYFSSDYVFDGVLGENTSTCEGRKSIYQIWKIFPTFVGGTNLKNIKRVN